MGDEEANFIINAILVILIALILFKVFPPSITIEEVKHCEQLCESNEGFDKLTIGLISTKVNCNNKAQFNLGAVNEEKEATKSTPRASKND